MISEKIKNLFLFIDYLHSNISTFKEYEGITAELELLTNKSSQLKPKDNFQDKIKFNDLQPKIKQSFIVINEKLVIPIKSKAKELKVCDFTNEPIYSWNGIESDILSLKDNFNETDLPIIFEHKSKYLQFRNETGNCTLDFFFFELDEILKGLFQYFSETGKNEFEPFETKANEVKGFNEVLNKLNETKDVKYFLHTFWDDVEQSKDFYKSFKNHIEIDGFANVKFGTDNIKIYTPELAIILITEQLQVRNMETQTETQINGRDYFQTYFEAYKEGQSYFDEKFKVTPDTLYANAEQYVRDIHLNLFHSKIDATTKGWDFVRRKYSFILTHNKVKEFGYYSGIVSKVEELISKYPKVFENIDKCEHGLQNEPNSNPNTEKYNKQITFKDVETIEKLHSEFKGYFDGKEAEFLKVLEGEQLSEKLLFPFNGSSFVEVFKRLKYNNFILSTPTQIRDWICKNFKYLQTKGKTQTITDFNKNTVWDVLTKAKCEPSKKNRICNVDWLPFIPQPKRQKEAENEKL